MNIDPRCIEMAHVYQTRIANVNVLEKDSPRSSYTLQEFRGCLWTPRSSQ